MIFPGQTVRFSGAFTDAVARIAYDPAGVTFKLRAPDGTVRTFVHGTDAALVRDALGRFHVDAVLDQSGLWSTRWESQGTAQGATEGTVEVAPSRF